MNGSSQKPASKSQCPVAVLTQHGAMMLIFFISPVEIRPALSDGSAGVLEEPSWDVILPGSREPVLGSSAGYSAVF